MAYTIVIIYQTSNICFSAGRPKLSNLTGQDEVPPRNSKATGNSTFVLNNNGMNMYYKANVQDIDNVTAAQIQQCENGENGPVAVTLIPFKASIPTGPVNGLLAEGNITDDKLQGPLNGKQISDLTALISYNDAYVNILTKQNPGEEIRGQIFNPHRDPGTSNSLQALSLYLQRVLRIPTNSMRRSCLSNSSK